MTHLSPEQLVDVAEGRGDPSTDAHAASCEGCRASVDGLREVLQLTRTDGVPEPSPLFWEHQSARLGASVRAEAESRLRRASWVWRWGPVAALGAAALVVALGVIPRDGANREPAASTKPPTASSADAIALEADGLAPADEASWLLMTGLSEEMTVDEARAAMPLLAGVGTADRALGHLNEAERAALVRIIREEMAHGPAAGAEPSGE
jgi:hypothetical protein